MGGGATGGGDMGGQRHGWLRHEQLCGLRRYGQWQWYVWMNARLPQDVHEIDEGHRTGMCGGCTVGPPWRRAEQDGVSL